MKANPDKFQAICVGKRTFDAVKSFQLGDTKILCEKKVSLFGVTIYVQLDFKDHISQLSTKASQQLAVLNCICTFLTNQRKLVIYESFIMSNFNHCPVVWHFCNQPSVYKRRSRRGPSYSSVITLSRLCRQYRGFTQQPTCTLFWALLM